MRLIPWEVHGISGRNYFALGLSVISHLGSHAVTPVLRTRGSRLILVTNIVTADAHTRGDLILS